METQSVKSTLDKFMMKKGFRHKYQIAKYFGVTPQALSIWYASEKIPAKHMLLINKELGPPSLDELPKAEEASLEQQKTVIDYLINENIILKNEIARIKHDISQLQSSKGKNDLLEKINAEALFISGSISDGTITHIGGNWKKQMGYDESELVGHRYDEGFLIHPEEFERTKKHQDILKHSSGIKETRFSTIQRWKHGETGNYVMLSMVWYANLDKDRVDIVAKPIDTHFDYSNIRN